jgi:aspartyl-tRNA(Asn)/glutamyl-tRNA(Gln) amidotransferase subunit B
MSGELARALNTAGLGIEDARVTPSINRNTAKKVFQDAFESGGDPAAIVAERGLAQVSDESAIAAAVAQVLVDNAAMVERFRSGEEKVFGALMGAAMKALKGQGKPDVVQRVLRKQLGS